MPRDIWTCTIGEAFEHPLPPGADQPMRQAVAEAYYRLTGQLPEFIFSGWGGRLTKVQRDVAFPVRRD